MTTASGRTIGSSVSRDGDAFTAERTGDRWADHGVAVEASEARRMMPSTAISVPEFGRARWASAISAKICRPRRGCRPA